MQWNGRGESVELNIFRVPVRLMREGGDLGGLAAE